MTPVRILFYLFSTLWATVLVLGFGAGMSYGARRIDGDFRGALAEVPGWTIPWDRVAVLRDASLHQLGRAAETVRAAIP
jgi:hypothetical protein